MVNWHAKTLPHSQNVHLGLLKQIGLLLRLKLLSEHFIKLIVGAKDYERDPKLEFFQA